MSEIERFICFSSSFVRDYVKKIARKFVNRISYQIETFRRGSKSAKGVHIRKRIWTGGPYLLRIWTGGSKSAVTPALISYIK